MSALVMFAVGVAASAEDGQPPPDGQFPPPDGQPPPGGDHGGEPPKGGPCTDFPPGVDPASIGPVFEQLKPLFDKLGRMPSDSDIDSLVAQAMTLAGISNAAVAGFVKSEIKSHMPGGKCEGGGGKFNPGADNDGMPDKGFKKGFLNRVHRVSMETDALFVKQRTLEGSIRAFRKQPKRYRNQDDELVESEALVLIRKSTRIYNKRGKRVSMKALADVDRVDIKAKLLKPKKWRTSPEAEADEETPMPTFRAKRIYIKK